MSKIQYSLTVNQPNDNFKTPATVTANEHLVETLTTSRIAEEINHFNPLIPAKVAEQVLDAFGQVAVKVMSESKGVKFQDAEGNLLWSLYPDVHLGKEDDKAWTLEQINKYLAKDKPLTELTEESIKGLPFANYLTLRAYAETGRALTTQLLRQVSGFERVGKTTTQQTTSASQPSTQPQQPSQPTPGGDLEE